MGEVNVGETKPSEGRAKKLIWPLIIFILIGIIWFCYWFFYSRHYRMTDDAYVHGNQIVVTSQTSGIVTKVFVDNTFHVKEGQILVELDKTDPEIAFNRAKSYLAKAVRDVSSLFENVFVVKYRLDSIKADVIKAEIAYLDRKDVVGRGAVSKEDFIDADLTLQKLRSTLQSTKFDLMKALSLVENTTIATHPYVKEAIEMVKQTYVNLQRCTIRAPATGIVGIKKAQVGGSITPSVPLMVIVPLNQIWVDGNFKEVDIAKMRVGQPVKITSDAYGSSVVYTGEVEGISVATGEVFSPLPPQNATGNWIKIVQRLPVRIRILSDQQLMRYPLRLGLSMHVRVDIRETSGKKIPPIMDDKDLYQTRVFHHQERGVEPIIEEIIRANSAFNLSLDEEVIARLHQECQ